MLTMQIQGGLTRLDLGFTSLENVFEIVEEAGGSGTWIIIEGLF